MHGAHLLPMFGKEFLPADFDPADAFHTYYINQGGLRIKKKYPGSIFFLSPCWLDLPTYVIRHMSKYGKMTPSS